MESVAHDAQQAREYGHKLRSWESTDRPVFDFLAGSWFELRDDGSKVIVSDSTF